MERRMKPKRMNAMKAKTYAFSKGERFPVKIIHDGWDTAASDLQKEEITFHVSDETPREWMREEAIARAKGFTHKYKEETQAKEISFLIDSKPKEWEKIRSENNKQGFVYMTGEVMDRLRAAKG